MLIIVRDEIINGTFLSYDENVIMEAELKKGWQEKMLAVGTFYSKDNNYICSIEQIKQRLKSEGSIKWLAVKQRGL
ncbi:hypothetical protein J7J13_00605 [bacterium]|nr:hypothetical protein [bacterium]